MALNTLFSLSPRSAQILGGADALLVDPAGAAHAADQALPVAQNAGGSLAGNDAPVAGAQAAAPAALQAPVAPVEATANKGVLDFHYTIEAAADQNGTPGTVHGVTNLGETVGLGKIGQPNLLTDALDAPAQAATGNTAALAHGPADLAAVTTAAEGLGAGALADAASGSALANPLASNAAAVSTLTHFPVASLGGDAATAVVGTAAASGLAPAGAAGLAPDVSSLNGIGNALATELQTSAGLLAPQTGPAAADLLHAVGVGALGGANPLTNVAAAPASLAAGDAGAVTHLPADLGTTVAAAAPVVAAAGFDIAHSTILGAVAGTVAAVDGGSSADAARALAALNGGAGAAVDAVETPVGLVAPHTGPAIADVAHAAGVGDLGGGNVATDLAATPAALAGGDVTPLAHAPGDAGAVLSAAGNAVAAAGSDIAHSTILNGAASLASGAGEPVHADPVGQAAALLGQTASVLGQAEPGGGAAQPAHDLATLSVGPQVATPVAVIDVLSSSAAGSHVVDVHVGSIAAAVPTLAVVAILPDGNFHFAAPTGGGEAFGSALSGLSAASGLPGAGAPAVHAAEAAPTHVDLPVAHADPLAELGHAIHHA